MSDDEKFMKMALDLSLGGLSRVNPNPLVGAVIVKDGEVISSGYHKRYGDLHAERDAFKNLGEEVSAEGATMYVTLEPCCHYGKTPPCTEAIIENKIKKVVIGTLDPNPLVSGKGAEILRDSGIEVVTGVLEKECKEINEVFIHYIKSKRPFVLMKYAMTLDGKIATFSGKSKWITGEDSRRDVHFDRARLMAIMVGINTVIKDDPMLNVRLDREYLDNCGLSDVRQPIRIICDSNLRIGLESKVVKTAKDQRTIIVTKGLKNKNLVMKADVDDVEIIRKANDGKDIDKIRSNNDSNDIDKTEINITDVDKAEKIGKNSVDANEKDKIRKINKLAEMGVEFIFDYTDGDIISLEFLMDKLGEMKIDSVLLEGGSSLHWSALESGIVTKVKSYIAPKIFGGKDALSPVSGRGVDFPDNAFEIIDKKIRFFGDDILVEGILRYTNKLIYGGE